MIAGRAIQGIGAGEVNLLIEIVICDLVPLRERGNYLALIFGLIAFGTALGRVFGGLIVDNTSWPWVFYLNLPVGGVALVLLVLFLQVNYERESTIATKLKRIDWTGNVIFVFSMVSILISLSSAGTKYSWSSFRVILPLILSLLVCVAFLFYEGSKFAVEPNMPIHLFKSRTSLTTFVLTFLHSIVTI
jgi:MFS family permease